MERPPADTLEPVDPLPRQPFLSTPTGKLVVGTALIGVGAGILLALGLGSVAMCFGTP